MPVPDEGSDVPKSQRGSQGLFRRLDFSVAFDGLDLTRSISDLSIPRMTDQPNSFMDQPCPCALCTGKGYRQYKPGPF